MPRHDSPFDSASAKELQCVLDLIVEAGADEWPRYKLAEWLAHHDQPHKAELLSLHLLLLATCCHPDTFHPDRVQVQARLVELLANGVRPCVPRQMIALAEAVDMTFAWIPPGMFLMGSPPSERERLDDETQHTVTLTCGFYLGVHPVTQAHWQAVMGNNPSHFKGDDRPVEAVSWDDCQAFCAKLGQLTGKRFRLPTEAEWEYACRAGTTTPFFFGDQIGMDQSDYALSHILGRRREQSTPVGSFPANAWGLLDMHGNYWHEPGYRNHIVGCRVVLCLD
ncbi:MAG TPA: formylglycine-generating enzyme family protein [Gemmataceae bacterium]|nr:formylglycine-generating enzyme family protein [Gemmataceae bacterium]